MGLYFDFGIGNLSQGLGLGLADTRTRLVHVQLVCMLCASW